LKIKGKKMENLNNKFGGPPLSPEVLNESQMWTKVEENWKKWIKKEWKARFKEDPTGIANEYRFVAIHPELKERYSDKMRKISLLMNKIIQKNIIQLPQLVIDTITDKDLIACLKLTEGKVSLEDDKEFCVNLKDKQLLDLLANGKIDLTTKILDLSHSKHLTSKSLSKLFQSMPNLTHVNLSYLSSGDYDRLINGENQHPQDLSDDLNCSIWSRQDPQLLCDLPNLSMLELSSNLCMGIENLGAEWNTWNRLIEKYFSHGGKILIIKVNSNDLPVTMVFLEKMAKYPHGRIELILAEGIQGAFGASGTSSDIATQVPITGYEDCPDYRVTFSNDCTIELKLNSNSGYDYDFAGADFINCIRIKSLTRNTQPILKLSYLKDYGESKDGEFSPQYFKNPFQALTWPFDHIKQIHLVLNRHFLSTSQWTFDDLIAFKKLKTIELEIDPKLPLSDFLQLLPDSNLYKFLKDKSYTIIFKQTEFEIAQLEGVNIKKEILDFLNIKL
jgi:hypothetical protein